MKDKQELLLSLLKQKYASIKVGILIKGIVDINPVEIILNLAKELNKELKATIVGYDTAASVTEKVEFSNKIEDAVKWRSDPKYAGSIIAFIRGDSEKLHSLAEFDVVTERSLVEQLAEECLQQQTNTPASNFWMALNKMAPHFIFEDIYAFATAIFSQAAPIDAIPQNMWRLGLLCDSAILNNNIDSTERLVKNRELIIAIGQMSEEHRKKLSRSLTQANSKERDTLQTAYRDLQYFFKYGKRETLKKLDFSIVQRLLAASVKKDVNTQKKNDTTEENTNTQAATILRGKILDERIARAVVVPNVDVDAEALDELLKHVRVHFDEDSQDNKDSVPVVGGSFDNDQIVLDTPRPALRKAVGAACNETVWGGIFFSKEASLRDAISEEPDKFVDFTPTCDISSNVSFDGTPLFTVIKRFDQQFLEQGFENTDKFEPILDRLIAARGAIIPHIDLLMYYPILCLGADKELCKCLIEYIDAWADLLRAYNRNEAIMHQISQKGSTYVAKALLLLDVLYVKTPTEWKGVLLPLHPLYLWRYYEVFKDIDAKREQIKPAEADSLTKALTALPQILNFLIVDKMISGDSSAVLPCSGSIDMLPTFENKTNRYSGNDGIESIEEVLSRWLAFAPYTHQEIRISTIDAPDTAMVLKAIKAFIDKTGCTRVVYDAYLTRGQNGNHDLARIDYSAKDYDIGDLIQSRRICVNLKNVSDVKAVKQCMKQKPVHIVFCFDQSAYSIEYGPSSKHLYVNPLVITYDYDFDDITHQGEVFPSSDMESGMIGDYHKLMKATEAVSSNRTPRTTYSADANLGDIFSLITDDAARWLVAADRSTNNYLPNDSILIGEWSKTHRTVSIWASQESRIIDQYIRLLQKYNLYPQKNSLINILSHYSHISSEGLISIPRYGADFNAIETKKKGLIGTIFAAAWYSKKHNNSLVASLDTADARLWLNNSVYGNERADLVALRLDEESNTLHIQPIEVKTRDDHADAKIEINSASGEKQIVGHAADQIASVVGILKEIFHLVETDTIDMFVSARREVLKYQIVSECFRHIHQSEWQKKWSEIFKKIFRGERTSELNIEISGILLHIKLNETGNGRTELAVNYPYQENCTIDFIELTAKEIQNDIFGTKLITQNWKSIDYGQHDLAENDIHENRLIEDTEVIDPKYDQPSRNSINFDNSEDWEEKIPEGSLTKTGGNNTNHRSAKDVSQDEIRQLALDFRRSCKDYRINLKECDETRAIVGTSVIRFYFKLARGQALPPLRNQLDDIGREMKRTGILVQTTPNSDELILDVPRLQRDQVLYSEVISKTPTVTSPEQLYFPLGRTPDGRDIIKDLGTLPHLLVGGSTGSGKTVFLLTLLASLLKTHPTAKDLQLVLSSSGLEDFIRFDGIPHLVNGKVLSSAAETTKVIKDVVFTEFAKREKTLADARVADIIQYNAVHDEKLAPMVVVVDEFADLTDQFEKKKDKESLYTPIRQIAQMGRKRGIHLVLCTQRPAADLVPTNIKAQLNGRLALRVNDANSSRMILEEMGAQHLQKHGDMIFKNGNETERAQGYFISMEEIDEIVNGLR